MLGKAMVTKNLATEEDDKRLQLPAQTSITIVVISKKGLQISQK